MIAPLLPKVGAAIAIANNGEMKLTENEKHKALVWLANQKAEVTIKIEMANSNDNFSMRNTFYDQLETIQNIARLVAGVKS